MLNNHYGSGNGQDMFYIIFKHTEQRESFYKRLGEFIERTKTKDLSADLNLLINLLDEPSERTPEALKKLEIIIEQYSNIYEVPRTLSNIMFEDSGKFPGFWGNTNEVAGREGGSY